MDNGYNLELFMLMRESPGLLHIEYIVSISQQYVNEGVSRTPYYVNEGVSRTPYYVNEGVTLAFFTMYE